MSQTSGTTPTEAAAAPQEPQTGEAQAVTEQESLGFASRGRARRRVRFLRKARELAYRDLGGLVYNLHRFGQRNDALVLAKLTTLGQIDGELRTIEAALGEHRLLTVLREAGITACPRCAAIHGSEDRFCPNCGFSSVGVPELAVSPPAQPAPPVNPPAGNVSTPVPPLQTPAGSNGASANAAPAGESHDGEAPGGATEILRQRSGST